MELFFSTPSLIKETTAEFDRFEARHILKTLRKTKGDTLHFTDGQGRLFAGTITSTRPVLTVRHEVVKELPLPEVIIHLAVGFIRHTRLDFIIEKGTELGIQKFFLLATRHSNYYTTNTVRWQKIARQAIKQSMRLYLPEITVSDSLTAFLPRLPESSLKIVLEQNTDEPLSEILLKKDSLSYKNIIFLIGPEGGLSPEELELARSHQFKLFSVGEHRLRTETAVLAAAAVAGLFLTKYHR
jgi:16S rRNA (uracil1498-N3)-methyltransferase